MRKLFTFLLLGVFLISFASAALTDNIEGYYKFDNNNLSDELGTYSLTNSGTSNGTGIIVSGRDFTPTDEIFVDTNYSFAGDFTFSAWVDIDTNSNHLFSDTGEFTGNEGRTRFDTNGIIMGTQSEANVIINDGTTLSIGAGYQHLVIKRSGTTMYVWIDGVDTSNSITRSGTLIINTIGGKPGAATGVPEFEGLMDEVGIWNRAISDAEILKLYNSGNGFAYPFSTAFPTIDLIEPQNNSIISDVGTNFSVELDSTEEFNISNVTYFVWDENLSLHNETSVIFDGNLSLINNTLFIDNFVLGDYFWNAEFCWENATFSNCTSSENNLTFSVVPFNTISESYSSSVLEGDASEFSINLSIITFERLSTISFVYNGTEFPASSVEYETNKWFLSINKSIPEIEGVEVVEFYWNVLLESGFSQNSTIHNQTILEISIDDCSVFTNQIFNFTMVDETTQEVLNGAAENTSLKIDMTFSPLDDSSTIIQFSKGYTEINPARVCMNNSIENSTLRMDAVIEYTAADKFVEFYNIQNYVFNATTGSQNITLYNLEESEGLEFKITYKGQDFIPVTDLILQIQRKYIDEGDLKTIEIPMSGTNGYTIAHLVPNDVIYNLIFIKDGSVLDTFIEVIADCQNPTITQCEINLNALISGRDLFNIIEDDDFFSSLTFDPSTREVSATYGILSGVSGSASLNVTLIDNFGNNTACSDSLVAAGGTLSCIVPGSFGDSTVYARVILDDVIKREGYISLKDSPKDQYKGVLIFSSIILLLFIFGIGVSDNPSITGVFFIIGALLLVGLNVFYSTSWTGAGATILWFIVAVIMVIVKGGSKR